MVTEDPDPDADEPRDRGSTLFVVLCALAFVVIAASAAYIAITWNG